MSDSTFASWGNYPKIKQNVTDVHWSDQLPAVLGNQVGKFGSTLPVGLGRSYGDSCLSASGVSMRLTNLNRVIHFDEVRGIFIAESGISLDDILSIIVPKGWFLPVTPGTKFVTLGGAIANDVHGKNHHVKGTFGCFVLEFGLFRSDFGQLVCNSETNADLYKATIGGLGLTGIITWASISLQRIQSTNVSTVQTRFGSISEYFQVSNELDNQNEFSVSWVDCTTSGERLGRGIYIAGNFCVDGKLEIKNGRPFTVPFTSPFSLINSLSVKAFNTLYWRVASPTRSTSTMHYEQFFYPLDRILSWNRAYGKGGFQQYQCLIPSRDAEKAIPELLATISKSGIGSFLVVLKRCGDIPSPGLLSFPKPGMTLAIDFPQSTMLQPKLLDKLNEVVKQASGRLYPAKDAQMSAEMFQTAYPKWMELNTLRDPAILSSFWARVTK